ncbi:MAG: hypothetical protein QXJ28_00450 [Candidatus Pacearchaeota archaeon]
MIKKEEANQILQLINSLDETINKIERSIKNKDLENFENSKKFALEIQNRIAKLLESN